MTNVRWERVPPPEPCTSPDGHNYVDLLCFGSSVPIRVSCDHCGRDWQVVVFTEENA